MIMAGEAGDGQALDALTGPEVDMLSMLYSSENEARIFLDRAGVPVNRLPRWSDSHTFWYAVKRIIPVVLGPDGRQRILAVALSDWPQAFQGGVGWNAVAPAVAAETPAAPSLLPAAVAQIRSVRTALLNAGVAVSPEPARWTVPDLQILREAVSDMRASLAPAARECADDLIAVCDRMIIEPVLARLDVADIPLSRLAITYRLQVRSSQPDWPSAMSVWPMLEEAAKAAQFERADPATVATLDGLERFVLAVAADRLDELAASGRQPAIADEVRKLLAAWVDTRRHSAAEAREYLVRCAKRQSWLVIDLGDEPEAPGQPLFPGRVLTAQLFETGVGGPSEPLRFGPQRCDRESELEDALRELLRGVGSRLFFVDIVAPRSLLDRDLSEFRILPRPRGGSEKLAPRHRVLMRWSPRWTEEDIFERLRMRAEDLADWAMPSLYLPPSSSDGPDAVQTWLNANETHPLLVATAGKNGFDALWEILLDGRAFVVWFPDGVLDDDLDVIAKTYDAIPPHLRRESLPEALGTLAANTKLHSRHVIIWDDPRGRNGFCPRWPVLETF